MGRACVDNKINKRERRLVINKTNKSALSCCNESRSPRALAPAFRDPAPPLTSRSGPTPTVMRPCARHHTAASVVRVSTYYTRLEKRSVPVPDDHPVFIRVKDSRGNAPLLRVRRVSWDDKAGGLVYLESTQSPGEDWGWKAMSLIESIINDNSAFWEE